MNKPLQAAAHALFYCKSPMAIDMAEAAILAFLRAVLDRDNDTPFDKMYTAYAYASDGDASAIGMEAAIQALIDHIGEPNKMVTDG